MKVTQYLSSFVSLLTLCSSAKPWSCKFLSPWPYSSTALDAYLTSGTLATLLMSIGQLICLKLSMFSSVYTGSENMGWSLLACLQEGFSWRSQTSFSSVVDLSMCSGVYPQHPVTKKELLLIILYGLQRPIESFHVCWVICGSAVWGPCNTLFGGAHPLCQVGAHSLQLIHGAVIPSSSIYCWLWATWSIFHSV